MFQLVIIEGIVTGKQWRFQGDYYFRLAHYRNPERPPKIDPQRPGRHLADYVTVRVQEGRLRGMPVKFNEGDRVRVTGFFQSRDYEEAIRDVARRAGVPHEALEKAPAELLKAVDRRVSTEIIAEDVFVLE